MHYSYYWNLTKNAIIPQKSTFFLLDFDSHVNSPFASTSIDFF